MVRKSTLAAAAGLVVVCGLTVAGALVAEAPEAVSPGTIDGVARIAQVCPTFSWGSVRDSRAYELVVYDLAGEADPGGEALSVRVPGAASTWTPSLDECLAPGGRYVWFVRSVGLEEVGGWSEGRVFEVVEGPTIHEVEQALRVLDRITGEDSHHPSETVVSGEVRAGMESATPMEGEAVDAPAALAGGVEIGDTSISIDGAEVVTTVTDSDALGGLSCADGQLAKWDSGAWVCGNESGGTSYLAGNQLELVGSTFNVIEGVGSGLNADTVDGIQASGFLAVGTDNWVNTTGDTMTGSLTVPEIGVTASTARAKLNTTGTTSELRIQNNGANKWSLGWNSDSKYLYFYDWAAPGGTRFVIEDDTGHFGVGTGSPEAQLDVRGSGTVTGGVTGFDEVVTHFLQTNISRHSAVSIDSADLGLAEPGQDPILYFSSGGKAVWDIRVDDSDYDPGSYDGSCNSGFRDSFEVRYQAGGVNHTALQLRPQHHVDNPNCPSGLYFVQMRVNAHVTPTDDNTFKLGGNGERWKEVWATNPVIQTSDVRLKEEIEPIQYGLAEVLRLRPVSYEWRASDDARTHLGLLAQEVEPIVPEAVRPGDKDDDAWAMTYSSLTPVLIKAIQDQQIIIERLQARVEALEGGR